MAFDYTIDYTGLPGDGEVGGGPGEPTQHKNQRGTRDTTAVRLRSQ